MNMLHDFSPKLKLGNVGHLLRNDRLQINVFAYCVIAECISIAKSLSFSVNVQLSNVDLFWCTDFFVRFRITTPDYIRQPSQAPSSPGVDEVDGHVASRQNNNIDAQVVNAFLEQGRHEIGMGVVGKLLDRRYRQSQIDKMQLEIDDFEMHR